jgi:hypothetical protein
MVNNFSEIQCIDEEILEIGLRQRKIKEKKNLKKQVEVQEKFQQNLNLNNII